MLLKSCKTNFDKLGLHVTGPTCNRPMKTDIRKSLIKNA